MRPRVPMRKPYVSSGAGRSRDSRELGRAGPERARERLTKSTSYVTLINRAERPGHEILDREEVVGQRQCRVAITRTCIDQDALLTPDRSVVQAKPVGGIR